MWTYNTTHELGFGPKMAPGKDALMISDGPEAFNTVADFSHLCKMETDNAKVNGGVPATNINFLSMHEYNGDDSPDFSNTSIPKAMHQEVYDATVKYLEHEIKWLLPKWNYDTMVAPVGVKGQDRLKHQYWRANFEPGDLYALSVAGSIESRVTPFKFRHPETGKETAGPQPFANMAHAGDHTNNGLDDGCAETATTSGVMAAWGLTGGKSPTKWTDWEDHLPPDWANPFEYKLVRAAR